MKSEHNEANPVGNNALLLRPPPIPESRAPAASDVQLHDRRLPLLLRLALASIFLVNFVVAIVQPEEFTTILE